MQDINLTVTGMEIDFETARGMAALIGGQGVEETTLISWCDRERGIHSPQCLKCEIKGEPGWEVYGRNHGGRLRIALQQEQYVFIYA